MCHIRFLILVMVLMAPTWPSHAIGSFQTKPAFPPVAKAGMPSVPFPSMPNLNARDLVGGCGKGRIRDQQTHRCRGPADIR
jgi:hypothetical protein